MWLGGLFTPEAYITASRQFVAQANSWSLEELNLEVTISDQGQKLKTDDCSFAVTNLKLQGATCKGNKLYLSSTISTDLPPTNISWVRYVWVVGGGVGVVVLSRRVGWEVRWTGWWRFAVTNLKVQGATCKSNKLYPSSAISTDLPPTSISWVRYEQPSQAILYYNLCLKIYNFKGKVHKLWYRLCIYFAASFSSDIFTGK